MATLFRLSLLLFSLLSIFILTHARLNLHRPDHDALQIFKRIIQVNGQSLHHETACHAADGIYCERRLVNNTHVLRITRIVLESHHLHGTLSPAIGRLSELRELSLPHNFLSGSIPPQISDCRKLEILNLRNNRFSGKVPPVLSSLIRLRIIDFASNELNGDLSFLRYFPNLEKLSLENNKFSGKIPNSVQSFLNLQSFNFSGNNGISLPKRYILLENSNTRSDGASSIAMTPSSSPLASKNLNSTDSGPSPSPSTSPAAENKKKKNKHPTTWILGFVAGLVAGTISGLLFSLLFKIVTFIIQGRGKEPGIVIFSQSIKNTEDLAFLQQEDGLASLELIGKGGCGEVYKSELPGSDGKLIAIKKIIPVKEGSDLSDEESRFLDKKMRQIKSEIQTVGQIRHRNLLPLLAYVPRPDCHFLIYEFMKNGSLQDTLYLAVQGKVELDWLARHKIAIGIATGLEYLHLSQSTRIIHRDLKPANVLLDDNMEARITDFGLAKVMPDANTHITASNVAGTAGYIAPEYHQTLKFTDKCDIYSFGVLLGALVMGKFPTDEFFQQTAEPTLVKWMRSIMTSEEPLRAIDPMMIGNGFHEQMLLVLKIACFCTIDDPKQRPNSKEVCVMLSQIKH
ncbi:leucine-rich repeat receptor-like serine/threonine/tyrosine-protein kinase SOBIR1 [Impatiens glandulifera]|uniref:leucine-rich repeat receptor-like serine/threonine/tyrosine-protein kinase SOBIR1 n=1 Tax=Impatiens glandulifera TaxID=253017 RepID=UPI001FB13088|nr:leucine-rich repeat receptor-like serine/threonine/tyrosine-protein kinase SOBIR1 [Impatiens glandulifera]